MTRAWDATELADYFDYLDVLRESGETNMFGAAPYLVRDQGLELREARNVLSMWMKSSRDLSAIDRAKLALHNTEDSA